MIVGTCASRPAPATSPIAPPLSCVDGVLDIAAEVEAPGAALAGEGLQGEHRAEHSSVRISAPGAAPASRVGWQYRPPGTGLTAPPSSGCAQDGGPLGRRDRRPAADPTAGVNRDPSHARRARRQGRSPPGGRLEPKYR